VSQRATSKIELSHKSEKQTENHHNIQTVEGADGTLNLPQKKGIGQRNKPSAWKSQ
jgi:hypothetical protein